MEIQPPKGIERILNWLFYKQPILREDTQLYLMRWYWNFKFFTFKIHKFYLSDDDCLHDHPWNFVSIILTTGYYEWQEAPFDYNYPDQEKGKREILEIEKYGNKKVFKRLYKPGSILFRKSTDTHRVELIDGKTAWTIVFTGPRLRKWGFRDKNWIWHYWREYVSNKHCG